MGTDSDTRLALRTLTLPLNGEYFDQIARGEKLEEYRIANDFWATRIGGREFDRIVLTRGYPKGGGVEGETRLTREWRGYQVRWITHPHFGDAPVQVFAINVATPLSLDPSLSNKEDNPDGN